MWTVTVKTLDGSNHKFDDVDPEKTVKELKVQISDKVGIVAERQRLIFCGRVLADEKKVSEYQVDGRVIHLVARPPPGQGPLGGPDAPDRVAESEARASRGASPAGRHRHTAHFHVHGGERVGAIGQSSPQVRLNLARDMISQANQVMDRLEGRERPATETPAASTQGPQTPTRDTPTRETPNREQAPEATPPSSEASSTTGSTPGFSTGFSTGPIQFMGPMGMTGEATATIHVQTEGQGAPPAGLAEAISAMVQQYQGTGVEGGHISLRVENGRVVREGGEGQGGNTASSGADTTTGAATGGNGVSDLPGTPSSIRHPPPSALADVLDLFNAAQTRLATHSARLGQLLRDDPSLNAEGAATHQTFYNGYSSCLHYLAHAQHAMSDIMLHLSRPPPRQVRARPFVIQSVVQSAVLQSVPIMTTMAPTPGAPPSGPRAPTGPVISGTATATSPREGSASRGTSPATAAPPSGAPQMGQIPAELAAHIAAVQGNRPGHMAAHQAAVAAAMQQSSGQQTASTGGSPVSLQQMLSSAMQAGSGAGGAQLQPVLVGIELGPELGGSVGSGGPPQGLQNAINSAIQQALRSGPPNGSTTSTSNQQQSNNANGPQVQVAVGAPIHIPMGPPPPPMGNLHSFDPFLPCSSHHVANGRSSSRTTGRPQRDVRSAPGSRSSSLSRTPEVGGTASAGQTPSSPPRPWAFDILRNAGANGGASQAVPPGLGGLLAGMLGGQPESGGQEADQNMIAMIQGVMGQVVGVLGADRGQGGGNNPSTIAQFLNTLPDYSYVAGENLVTDLLMTLAQHLTFQDMVSIVGQNPSPTTLAGLQTPLQQFLRERVLLSPEISRDNVDASVLAVIDSWHPQLVEAGRLSQVRSDVDFPETMANFLSHRPMELIMLVLEADSETFTGRLGETLKKLLTEATALCLQCFTDGTVSLEAVVEDRLGALTEDVGSVIRQWTLGSAISHLRSFVAGVSVEQGELDQWIIRPGQAVEDRNAARAERISASGEDIQTGCPPNNVTARETIDMDVDDTVNPVLQQPREEVAHVNRPETNRRRLPIVPIETEQTFPASLLAVPVNGSMPPGGPVDRTLAVLPPEWGSIIARDNSEAPRSGRTAPQAFSEAYMSGQPSKRRKLNAEKKPKGDVNTIIARSLQDAIEQTGLEPSNPTVVAEIASDPSLQEATEMHTRQNFQDRIEADTDFQDNKERFPAADSFYKN